MQAATDMRLPALLILALALCPCTGAWAEKLDRSRPIQIEANSVRLDDLKKTSVYQGNVVLTQGTLVIKAERVDVHQDKAGMAFGEAVGNPVSFRQKMEGREEYLEAQANRLEYDAAREVVKLIGGARLKRGGDELRGALITYDVRSEVYRAEGSIQAGGQGRVRAVIQPRTSADGDESGKGGTGAAAKP